MRPAIVVVAYNRAFSLSRLLSSIARAKYPSNDIPLIISIDNHPTNQDVISLAEAFRWEYGEKRVATHSQRLGLRPHVLECGDYSKEFGCVIILEDDLAVAEDFYYYAVAAQNYYQDNDHIAGVALYRQEWNDFAGNVFRPILTEYSVFFRQSCESWGQSWTEKQWKGFRNWLENNPVLIPNDKLPKEVYGWPETSWGKYFCAYVVENGLYFVFPYIARSTCFSEVGQHTGTKTLENQVCLMTGVQKNFIFPEIDQGVHYDIFFENMDLQDHIKQWTNGEPCRINLYGKHSEGDERFVLTTKWMPYRVIHSFALELRPPEYNVIRNVEGEGIFLYDLKQPVRCKNKDNELYIMDQYDLSGFANKPVILYLAKNLIKKVIRNRLRRLLKF